MFPCDQQEVARFQSLQGMVLLENALVDGPKLNVKFKPVSWQDFVTFGDQGWITNQ
jgi:hypothetical protein